MSQQESSSKGFPLLALIIALSPVISIVLFMTDVPMAMTFVIVWSGFLLAWVVVMMGKKIWYTMRGKKEPEIKKWEQQLTVGGTWYFVSFFLCIMLLVALHGMFAG